LPSLPWYVNVFAIIVCSLPAFGILFLFHKLEERIRAGNRSPWGMRPKWSGQMFLKIMLSVNVFLLAGIFIAAAGIWESLNRHTQPRVVSLPLDTQDQLVLQDENAKERCKTHGHEVGYPSDSDFSCTFADRLRYEIRELHRQHPDLPTAGID
jgi:hypothetical protein